MATNPCHTVLHIPELVELILSHLGYHDLVSARRTSKCIREIINASSLLRRIHFLEPCPVTSVVRWSGTADPDLSFEILRADARDLPHNQERLRRAGHPVVVETFETRSGDLRVATMNPVFLDARWTQPSRSMISFKFDITDLDEFVAEDPKRADMLVCQPAPSVVQLKVDPLPWDGSHETRPGVLDEPFEWLRKIRGHDGKGVRLRDLQNYYREVEGKRASRLDDECRLKIEGYISERSRWLAVARGEMAVDNVHRIRLGAGWL